MNVYLLNRPGRKGKTSLYLLYVNGKRRHYQFLKLYTYDKPRTNLEKQHNKETLQLAKTILAQKTIDAQYAQHNLVSPVKGKVGLLHFFQKVLEKKRDSTGNYGTWCSVKVHLTNYMKGEDLPLEKVDDLFLEGFKEHLLNAKNEKSGKVLSRNSALAYFSKLKVVLKEAFHGRYIKENPSTRVKGIKGAETHRQYLTLEEIKKLIVTDCVVPELKTAFLFSCFTGLRFSDVQTLCYEQLNFSEVGGWQLKFTQKKTKGAEVLPVSFEAIQLLGNISEKVGKVFSSLTYSAWTNLRLKEWVLKAGITKNITFHSGRHTFATSLLSMDTDIYTVSKLLGHKHLKTTEVYAKVIDTKKIKAVSKFGAHMN